ncbi:MAG: GtrA family protein [Ruminococcaceae bacterium]|nr:GtrA family protein [Oscillospiraceae bacterium]
MIVTLWKKWREPILYLIFGGLTTLVNLVVFKLCGLALGDGAYLLSNIIAWCVAVAFAFFVNKFWVFDSKSFAWPVLRRELPSFLGARVFSLVVEEIGLWVMIDLCRLSEVTFSPLGFSFTGTDLSKLVMQVVVVVLNYIFSKFFIFKSK